VPIWFKAQKAKAEAAAVEGLWWQAQAANFTYRLEAKQNALLARLEQHRQALEFYENSGATLAEELRKTAQRSFEEGEIDFFQYLLSLDKARKIQIDYLHNLYQYDLVVLDINYITN
jgi:cobalt-zinc-cadmium resistance protein CzcA